MFICLFNFNLSVTLIYLYILFPFIHSMHLFDKKIRRIIGFSLMDFIIHLVMWYLILFIVILMLIFFIRVVFFMILLDC